MAKRATKYLIVIGILAVLFAFWWFAPKKLLDGIDASEISYIQVMDGNTGKLFEIDNPEYINYIMHNLKQVKLYKNGMSLGHSGYGYKLKFYDNRERMLATFSLNSQSLVRKDPFFYLSSNGVMCTEYIAKLEEEMIWTPSAPPVVSDKMTEEEKIEHQSKVYTKGELIFAGETNEGYIPKNSMWMRKASKEDSIVLVYTCDDATHSEWGVLGIGATVNGENFQKELAADKENPTKTTVLFATISQLEKALGITDMKDAEAFYVGAWNGGRIIGLYYLDQKLTEEMNQCLATIEATDALIHNYNGTLSNPKAIDNAVNVYNFLKDSYGKVCVTGQQESTWKSSVDYEIDYIQEHTGKLPAIRGFDFMDNDFEGVTQRAKAWAAEGGLVTICWHTGIDFSSGYNASLKDSLDWDKALTPGTPEFNDLVKGMDRAVPYLQELEKEKIPVLWRPFHEMDGTWFWWSKGGAENFVKLWQMMYSRYTDYWELDNLIWVLGYSGNAKAMDDWYPGDTYVDLIGADSYSPGANHDLFEAAKAVAPEGMPVVYHECGAIPTEKQLEEMDTAWTYFMTWHTDYLTDDRYNPIERLNEVYNSKYFITRDELPALYE